MRIIEVPRKLFADLREDVIECLNNAIDEGRKDRADTYRLKLQECDELLQKEKSKPNKWAW